MSWTNAIRVIIPPDLVRDQIHPEYNQTVNVTVDCWNKRMIGLDMLLHNRGGTAFVVSVNNEVVKSVPPGAAFEVNDMNIGLIHIAGAGAFLYDLVVLGVSLDKLKRLKVI